MSKTMLRIVAIVMIVLIVAFSGCVGGDKEPTEVEPTPAPTVAPTVAPTPAATPAATPDEDIKEADAEKGCDDLDQSVLRRYDHNKDGLIDSHELETAKIGYESNYEKQSDYEQIVYAYDHKCPVEPAE
ncbi:MAG: hypothetical protein C5S52_04280 [ANME-2 cluster archaeon]|nr:hypothetical protein [ANME-2 cluster archaeon]